MDTLPKLKISSLSMEPIEMDLTGCDDESFHETPLEAPRINYNLEKGFEVLRKLSDTEEIMVNVKEVSNLINKFDYYKSMSSLPPNMLVKEHYFRELKEMSLFPLYDDDMKQILKLAKIFRFNTEECIIAWRMLNENKFCVVLTAFASLDIYNKRTLYSPLFTPISLAK
jgi:hypothetical protein